LIDAWRLSLGTFTSIPVRPPAQASARTVGASVLIAPIAVAPLAAAVALLLWAGRELELAPIAVAATAIGALALGSRAFHLDGLSDTADGLTSSYDQDRAREIARRGDTGPAGAAALVLVLGVQIGAVAGLLSIDWGPAVVGAAVCVSRATAAVGCTRGVPPARTDGLGASYAETIRASTTALVWTAIAVLLSAGATALDEPWWRGAVVAAAALAVTGWLLRRARRRLGGMTGDVLGASIELSLAVMLLAAS